MKLAQIFLTSAFVSALPLRGLQVDPTDPSTEVPVTPSTDAPVTPSTEVPVTPSTDDPNSSSTEDLVTPSTESTVSTSSDLATTGSDIIDIIHKIVVDSQLGTIIQKTEQFHKDKYTALVDTTGSVFAHTMEVLQALGAYPTDMINDFATGVTAILNALPRTA